MNGLTFSARVLFSIDYPGSIFLWDTGAFNIGTNINGTTTIPGNTWKTVTATISDGGGASTQLGMNFRIPFDSAWSGTVWIDNITIK